MSKLLLLMVKMGRTDIPVSQIGSHVQTFSVADEGLGGDDVFLGRCTLSTNVLVWKKNRINCGRSHDRSIEELILPSK